MRPSILSMELVQEAPEPREVEVNANRVAELLHASSADLLVFPELYLSGYELTDLEEVAITLQSPVIKSLASVCALSGVSLLVGFVEVGEDGYYDSYLAIDGVGTGVKSIRKTHLFGAERDVFLAGDTLEPIVLAGVRMGILNCFELEFPEVARTLVLRGASILVSGAANMQPYANDHGVAVVARALENRVPVAYVNHIGISGELNFCGLSQIVDATGLVIESLGRNSPGIAKVEIELEAPIPWQVDMLSQRRPELYA